MWITMIAGAQKKYRRDDDLPRVANRARICLTFKTNERKEKETWPP